jgi:hypothetical protein
MAVSKYGSYRTMTAYESATAWAAKRKAARQKFEAEQSAVSSILLNVGDTQSQGLAEIVAQIALKRITEEGKVKAEKNAKLAEFDTEVDTGKADITLTLSDGTVIDIKTGVKKVNITV